MNPLAGALLLHGATAVDARGVITNAWLLAEGGNIVARGSGEPPACPAERIDVRGGLVTPGFIDLHVHGGGGASNEDGAEAILLAAATHARHGTTRTVVSLVSRPIEELERSLGVVAELTRRPGSRILGAHLEGPFLAEVRRGAHESAYLVDPDPRSVERLLTAADGTLVQLTIDPDRPGAADAIRRLAAAGTTVAIGHTDTDFDAAKRAFDLGAGLLTHAGNAMAQLEHRAPGPIAAAIGSGHVVLEVILDLVHLHPAFAEVLFRSASGRVALVTDAMAAAGAADGEYQLGGLVVEVVDGVARTVDGALAGSTLTQDRALRGALGLGLPLPDAVAALTSVPARAIGQQHRLGLLEPGFPADLVLLDDEFRVLRVFGGGVELSIE